MIARALRLAGLLAAPLLTVPVGLSGQGSEPGQGSKRSEPAFRFSRKAGAALQALWDQSLAARAERVACARASIRNDTVFVDRILPLASMDADSMGIAAEASVERCGPPDWQGTVHTHIAEYANGRPSTKFSAQDRSVMRMWYDRWHADGVFCVVYSREDAHCEADGVVGGLRSRPRVVR